MTDVDTSAQARLERRRAKLDAEARDEAARVRARLADITNPDEREHIIGDLLGHHRYHIDPDARAALEREQAQLRTARVEAEKQRRRVEYAAQLQADLQRALSPDWRARIIRELLRLEGIGDAERRELQAEFDTIRAAQEREQVQRERERLTAHRAWLLDRAGLPPRHAAGIETRNSVWAEKLATLCRTIREPGATILVFGPHGRGKTQLLVEAIRDHVGNMTLTDKTGPVFWDARAVMTAYRSRWSRPAGEPGGMFADELLDRLTRCSLLAIDEADKPDDASRWQALLAQVVNERYCHHRSTIIAGNGDRADAIRVVGPSVWSRSAEAGGFISTTSVPDFRSGKRKEPN